MTTTFFNRRDGELYVEDLSVAEIARQEGTPVFIYSQTALRVAFEALDKAFSAVPHTVCFAIKSNMNLAVVRTLVDCGAGVDVTSGGELFRALRAGADPQKIVYSGVGKTDAEVDEALDAGIRFFNLESRAELGCVNARAAARGVVANITFRVNPDVDPKTHPYISTGLKNSKFGIPIAEARDAYAEAKTLDSVKTVGVDCHIGSQLTDAQPFHDALLRVRSLVEDLRNAGHEISYLDCGGGLGVVYKDEEPPSPEEYAKAILDAVGDLGCEIVLEPGRWITANAGLMVTEVVYEKNNGGKTYTIVDGAMTDLLRPALYQAYQHIEPVGPARGEERIVDIVGPVCESGDFLAKERPFPPVEKGDYIAVFSAGAYGFSMSSNYNGRRRAAEVLVCGDRYSVVRARESYEDLIRGENLGETLDESLDEESA
ncbi:MAG: diaminopimelate decarboxylase [Deltaproteobacteria bacterium]|nr:diaminopimelate decarboxylase [Deltaproteobacteria bacterium]